jgi:hypothetical protein
MAHRIAPRWLLALRNVAAGLALIVTPALLYLGVGGQAAQAATAPDWTLQADGTTVCTTFTGFSWGTTTGPPPAQSVAILSGLSGTCLPWLTEEQKTHELETLTVSHVTCSAGTPKEVQYVLGGASVHTVQWSGSSGGDDIPTAAAQFTYQTVAITYPQPGGSC